MASWARFAVTLILWLFAASAGAQEASGYWLYVAGSWKAGFVQRADCEAAGVKAGGPYECRPVSAGRQAPANPDEKWAADVKYCSYVAGVEAYASGPDRSRVIGSERGRFEFGKCMTERGHQLR